MGFIQYVIILRIKDWAHILGLTILGYIYAAKGNIHFIPLSQSILISALYLGYGYSLNEYFDTKSESYKKIAPIASKNFFSLSYIVIIIDILIAYSLHWQTALIVIFGAIAGAVYSTQPFRVKERHLWGLFCNALCFAPLFLIGYSAVKNLDLGAMLMGIFVCLFFLPVDLIHQLNDYREDKENKIRTFAVRFGIKKTIFLAVIALLFTLLWALFLSRCLGITKAFFFSTLFFTLLLFFYLMRRFIKYGNNIAGYNIKLRLRYLLIAYGASLLAIFQGHNK